MGTNYLGNLRLDRPLGNHRCGVYLWLSFLYWSACYPAKNRASAFKAHQITQKPLKERLLCSWLLFVGWLVLANVPLRLRSFLPIHLAETRTKRLNPPTPHSGFLRLLSLLHFLNDFCRALEVRHIHLINIFRYQTGNDSQ